MYAEKSKTIFRFNNIQFFMFLDMFAFCVILSEETNECN